MTTGQLIDNKQIAAAKELDARIRECLRDYVQLGKLLMEMRDNQAYRLVGPYDTFEDYCKDVEGLAYSKAREKIRAYLVHKAITENLGAQISAPNIESQVNALYYHENAIAKFKTEQRMVEKKDGTKTPVIVPVAVANPKKVAEAWTKIVKAHEETVQRAEARHAEVVSKAVEDGEPEPAFRRPKLTGSFVVNHLPTEHQPVRKTSGEAHHFVRWVSTVMKGVESIDKMYESSEAWTRLTTEPNRRKLTKSVVSHVIKEIDECFEVLRLFKKDLKNEFGIDD